MSAVLRPRALVASVGRHVVSTVCGLLTFAWIARALGAAATGAWAVLAATTVLFSLADLGLSTVVQRAAIREDREDEARASLSTAIFVALVLGSLAGLSLVALGPAAVGAREALGAVGARGVIAAIPFIALSGIFSALSGPLRAFALGRGALDALALSRVLGAITQLAALGAALSHGLALRGAAMALCLGTFVELLGLARAVRRADPTASLAPRCAPWKTLRGWLSTSAAALSVHAAVAVAVRADVAVLARVIAMADVGGYAVASRATDQLFSVAKQVSPTLVPAIGRERERDDALAVGTAALGALVAAGLGSFALLGQPLLVAWAGPVAAGPVTADALRWLSLAVVLGALCEMPTSVLLLSAPSPWSAAVPQVVGSLAHAAGCAALASLAGPRAAAISAVLGNALIAVWVWRSAARMQRWNARRVWTAVAPTITAGAVAIAAARALAPLSQRGALGSLVACCVGFALALTAAIAHGLHLHRRRADATAALALTTEART